MQLADLRIFTEPQQGATYDDLLAVARRAEQLGFGAFFRSDHYLKMGGGRRAAGPDRRVDHARRPGPRHLDDPARHARHVGHVPLPRPAGHHRRPGRPDERRAGRARARRRLVRGRAPGLRHPVPDARRALRPPRGAAGDHHRPVGHAGGRDVRATRAALPGVGLAGAPQAGAAAAAADHRRRRRRQADARASRPGSRPSSTCRSARSTASPSSAIACVDGLRERSDATRPRCLLRGAHRCASARTRPRSPAGPRRSAASPSELRRTASPARRRGGGDAAQWQEAGAQRIYLQVLDLADLDHLDLIADEVAPRTLNQ